MLLPRPMTIPFPNVWSRFERSKNGKTFKFEIREADQNEFEDLINYMETYFMREETWNKAVGIADDPLAVEEFRILFRYLIGFNYHLVCFDVTDPDHPTIVACNALVHVTNEDEPQDEKQFTSKPITKLLQMFDEVKNAVDICSLYGVTEYLNGAGLSTHPDYRGMGLAFEILKARDPMCKAFGFKVTAAAFTGYASQQLAEKCGYKTVAELDYKKLGEQMNVTFDPLSKVGKVMVYTYFDKF